MNVDKINSNVVISIWWYWFYPACTGDGGKAGDSQSRGTCDVGKVCSPYGNCTGK